MDLCTLFDSNYLDKGLVLLKSLYRTSPLSIIYVLPFDDRAEEILNDMKLKNVRVVSLQSVETTELLALKEKRSRAEYVWTFTAIFIEYILLHYDVEYCTYIDADMYFYSDPEIILNELIVSKKSVGVTEHRFRNTLNGKKMLANGKYCVEFNTFKNDDEGKKLLSIWKKQCIEECSLKKSVGDQGYISDWGEKYPDIVHEYQNIGGGVAPWNISRYEFFKEKNQLFIKEKSDKREMVFYHFQGISYEGSDRVKLNVFGADNGFVRRKNIRIIYYPYLCELEKAQEYLKDNYDLKIGSRGRIQFHIIPFEFSRFIKSFVDKIKGGYFIEALDLVARVLRKKQDIVILKNRKLYRRQKSVYKKR